jgi:hypothetical protein
VSRLNALIQQQIQLRESVKTEEASEQGQVVKAFDVKEFLAKQELALNQDLLDIKKKLAAAEGDFTKTDAEKYAERKKLLADEIKDYQTAINQNNTLINSGSVAPEDQLALSRKNERLSSGLTNAQDSLGKMGADPNSFGQQFTKTITDIKNQWGTTAQQMAQSFGEVFNGAISSISSGITGLIMGTKTWGQALTQIGTTILTDIVQAIVQMGIRWVATRLFMSTAGKSIATAETAALTPIATIQSGIWSVPATLATIASYGGAAAAAPGLIGLAEAAVGLQSLAGFAGGGYTGDGAKYDVAGLVHRGEVVFSQDDVARNGGVGSVENMRRGGGSGAQEPIHIHIWADEHAMLQFLRKNDDAKNFIVHTVNRRVRRE